MACTPNWIREFIMFLEFSYNSTYEFTAFSLKNTSLEENMNKPITKWISTGYLKKSKEYTGTSSLNVKGLR